MRNYSSGTDSRRGVQYRPMESAQRTPSGPSLKPHEWRDFYDELSQVLRSGVPLRSALEILADSDRSTRASAVRSIAADIANGSAFSDAVWLRYAPYLDCALIKAGEASGELPAMLESIVRRRDARSALRGDFIRKCGYSCVCVAFALLLLPLPMLIEGRVLAYLAIQLCIGGPLAVTALFLVCGPAWADKRHSPLGRLVDPCYLGLPIVGTRYARLAVAHLFDALGLLLRAGISYDACVTALREITPWTTIQSATDQFGAAIENGATAAEASGAFEPVVGVGAWRDRVRSGEIAGHTDQAFREIAARWESEFQTFVTRALRLLPILAILCVGGGIVYYFLNYIGRLSP